MAGSTSDGISCLCLVRLFPSPPTEPHAHSQLAPQSPSPSPNKRHSAVCPSPWICLLGRFLHGVTGMWLLRLLLVLSVFLVPYMLKHLSSQACAWSLGFYGDGATVGPSTPGPLCHHTPRTPALWPSGPGRPRAPLWAGGACWGRRLLPSQGLC